MKTLALLIAIAATARAEDVKLCVCPAPPPSVSDVRAARSVQPNSQTSTVQPVASSSNSGRSFIQGSVNVRIAFTVKRW